MDTVSQICRADTAPPRIHIRHTILFTDCRQDFVALGQLRDGIVRYRKGRQQAEFMPYEKTILFLKKQKTSILLCDILVKKEV